MKKKKKKNCSLVKQVGIKKKKKIEKDRLNEVV